MKVYADDKDGIEKKLVTGQQYIMQLENNEDGQEKYPGKKQGRKEKKTYLISCIRTIRVEEYGAAALVLIHQTRVLEMSNQGCFPLDSGISE